MVLFVNPGALRTELRLEAMTPIDDGAGGHTESWGEVAVLFGHVEPQAARQRPGADQTVETVTHRVTIRHRGDVASGMRLRRGQRLLAIATVHDPDETGRYLVLGAREAGP